MARKGQTVEPIGYERYLAEFIYEKRGAIFTAAEAADVITARMGNVPRRCVIMVVAGQLLAWTRRSVLLRDKDDDGRFVYLGPSELIPTIAPQGSVAEAVWQVLYSTTSPLRRRDICNMINPEGGRSLSMEVGGILNRWRGQDAVVCNGERRQYTYRLTDEARARGTRLSCGRDKKPHPVVSDGNMAHMV